MNVIWSLLLMPLLTTYEQVVAIPDFLNTAARPQQLVNLLIGAADESIKKYCKRDFELKSYTDFYDGDRQRDLVLRQLPVWLGTGFLDPTMNGVVLPQATITVLSTQGFHPGTAGNPNANPPAVAIQTGVSSWTSVTYTGTTATTFTGCSGGTGTMQTNPGAAKVAPISVYSPVVFLDPQGYGGQLATSFGASTQLIGGQHYQVVVDGQGDGSQTPIPLGVKVSKCGLIRYNGGGSAFFYPWTAGETTGRTLAGRQLPTWPFAPQGIKVIYTAGYNTIPHDLAYATAMLVCQMIRIQPSGDDLASQNLGQYSYSLLNNPTDPSMGTIRRILSRYREPAFAMGR